MALWLRCEGVVRFIAPAGLGVNYRILRGLRGF